MFNEIVFWKILFSSAGNVYLKNLADLNGNNKTCEPRWEEVAE